MFDWLSASLVCCMCIFFIVMMRSSLCLWELHCGWLNYISWLYFWSGHHIIPTRYFTLLLEETKPFHSFVCEKSLISFAILYHNIDFQSVCATLAKHWGKTVKTPAASSGGIKAQSSITASSRHQWDITASTGIGFRLLSPLHHIQCHI